MALLITKKCINCDMCEQCIKAYVKQGIEFMCYL